MVHKAFELGDHEIVWYDGVGYAVTRVDEYGIDVRPIAVPGRGFNHNAVESFQKTEEVYGGKDSALFMLGFMLARHESMVEGLKKEYLRLKDLPE